MKEIYARTLGSVTSKLLEPVTCRPNTSLSDAVAILIANDIGSVVVVNDENYPVGILTERDLLRKVLGKQINLEEAMVADYMTSKPQTLSSEKPVSAALARMRVGAFRHVGIVDEEGKLIKVFSVKDALDFLSDEISEKMSELLTP